MYRAPPVNVFKFFTIEKLKNRSQLRFQEIDYLF